MLEEQKLAHTELLADGKVSPLSAPPTAREAPSNPVHHETPVQQPPPHRIEEPRIQDQQTSLATDATASKTSTRLRTACINCRTQKIKCRTTDELATPCERCARMKLNCIYEPRHSRARPRSDSDAATNDTPKRRLVSRNEESGFSTFTTVNGRPSISHEHSNGTNGDSAAVLPRLPYTFEPVDTTTVRLPFNGASDRRPSSVAESLSGYQSRVADPVSTYKSPASTVPRNLDGLQFNAELIDSLFAHYFKHYHPFRPILDSSTRPNDYYTQSSLLFWTILALGSRRWPKDTSLSALRCKVLAHASTCLFAPTMGLSSMTAVLLLLHWSLPEAQMQEDMPFMQSSALLHAAMQQGYHMPYASSDFSRGDVLPSRAELDRRHQIYTYCLILHQRSACCMGHSVGNIPSTYSSQARLSTDNLPTSLRFQYDVSRILTNAAHEIASSNLDFSIRANLDTFQGILDDFTANLNSYAPRALALSSLDRLYYTISVLILQALQFLKPVPSTHHLSTWRKPFDAACELIHQLHDLEKTMHIDLYGTSFVSHGVLLAACTLLRCLKTPFADTIGREASTSQALFFSAINMIRNISLVDGDKPAKGAWTLQQLWRSQNIYKKADGTWDLELHVRQRFGSSVLFDTMWWSRHEFATQVNAYPYASALAEKDLLASADGFEPDQITDMTLPQDWVVSDWERKVFSGGSYVKTEVAHLAH